MQNARPPYSYHKRWVIVLETGWILWNERMISTNFSDEGAPSLEERSRFKGAINLKNVMTVDRTGKSGKKFALTVRFKTQSKLRYKKVVWKCHDERERDFWCDGLAQYVDYCKEIKRLYGL